MSVRNQEKKSIPTNLGFYYFFYDTRFFRSTPKQMCEPILAMFRSTVNGLKTPLEADLA